MYKKPPVGCFYYLHCTGYVIPVFDSIVRKSGETPEEFFDLPHIVKWWKIYTKDQYKEMMKEIDEIWASL